MGKRIRELRLRRDLTQERLAELTGVTAQAVSKWENGVNYPDISALPELSAVLGVTLDELFDITEATHLRRIEQMIEDGAVLSEEDFRYAEGSLRERADAPTIGAKCLTLLAQLYLARAERYKNLAADCAKRALRREPTLKEAHSALSHAMGGALWDWCASNHTAAIDYYREFTAEHPDDPAGYLWYLDDLIADGRLPEARDVLERMRSVRDDWRVTLYEGAIAEAAGERREAELLWDEMVEREPDNWMTWFSRADAYAKRADYEKALADLREGVKRQTPPRYTDGYDSIAQICAIIGDKAGAQEAYETILDILREDWGLTEGETVTGYLENIRELEG